MKLIDFKKEDLLEKEYTIQLTGRQLAIMTANAGKADINSVDAYIKSNDFNFELERQDCYELYDELCDTINLIGLTNKVL